MSRNPDPLLDWYFKYLRDEKKMREEMQQAGVTPPPDPPEVSEARLAVHQECTLRYYMQKHPEWKPRQ